jgi:hypothetical protein
VTIGALLNPTNANVQLRVSDLQAAASAPGRKLQIFLRRVNSKFDSIFTSIVEQVIGALVVMDDPVFDGNAERLVRLVNQHASPAIYQYRQFAEAGGLISYGPTISEGYRHVGLYAGRILKGEKPPTFRFCSQPNSNDHQPQDREGARYQRAGRVARPRRRGDRITGPFLKPMRKPKRSKSFRRPSTTADIETVFSASSGSQAVGAIYEYTP